MVAGGRKPAKEGGGRGPPDMSKHAIQRTWIPGGDPSIAATVNVRPSAFACVFIRRCYSVHVVVPLHGVLCA